MAKKNINPIDKLKLFIKKCGSQKNAATQLSISPQLLCDILKKRRRITNELLTKLGMVAIVTYKEKRHD